MATKGAVRRRPGGEIEVSGPERPSPSARLGAYDAVISAGARVPARRQLAAQLAGAIRSGRYGPGQRLPGARDLARRLGVDRGTAAAAYHELARRGLVTVRPGSGAYVTRHLDPLVAADGDPFRRFVARERAAGRAVAEVAGLVDRWAEAVAARRIVVAGDDPRLLAVWEAEVGEELEPVGVEVRSSCLARARRDPSRLEAAVVAAPPGTLPAVGALAPRWAELLPLVAGLDGTVRRLFVQLPRGAVVAVVSGSESLRRETADLAAGLRGGDVAVAGLDPGREAGLARVLPVARFVLADVPSREEMRGRVPAARLRTLRHLRRSGIREMAEHLVAGAPRPAAAGGPRDRRSTP